MSLFGPPASAPSEADIKSEAQSDSGRSRTASLFGQDHDDSDSGDEDENVSMPDAAEHDEFAQDSDDDDHVSNVDDENDESSDSATSRPRFGGSAGLYREYIAEERKLHKSLQEESNQDLSRHLLSAYRLKQQYNPTTIGKSIIRDSWTSWPLPLRRPARDIDAGSRSDGTEYLEPQDSLHIFEHLRQCLIARTSEFSRETLTALDLDNAEPQRHSRASSQHSQPDDASRSRSRSRSRSSSLSASSQNSEGVSICADDEHITELLNPLVNHLVARLEDLSLALHKSRAAIGRNVEEGPGKLPAKSKGKQRVKTEANEEEKMPSRAPKNLKPRGWQEVLGLAAIIGWDAGALHRASSRCARLFDENISFVTLREDDTAEGTRMATYKPDLIPSLEELLGGLPAKQPVKISVYKCPHKDCKLASKIFEAQGRLNQHVRRAHGWDPATEDMPLTKHGAVHIDGYMQPISRKRGWVTTKKDRALSEALISSSNGSDSESSDAAPPLRARKRRAASELQRDV